MKYLETIVKTYHIN